MSLICDGCKDVTRGAFLRETPPYFRLLTWQKTLYEKMNDLVSVFIVTVCRLFVKQKPNKTYLPIPLSLLKHAVRDGEYSRNTIALAGLQGEVRTPSEGYRQNSGKLHSKSGFPELASNGTYSLPKGL